MAGPPQPPAPNLQPKDMPSILPAVAAAEPAAHKPAIARVTAQPVSPKTTTSSSSPASSTPSTSSSDPPLPLTSSTRPQQKPKLRPSRGSRSPKRHHDPPGPRFRRSCLPWAPPRAPPPPNVHLPLPPRAPPGFWLPPPPLRDPHTQPPPPPLPLPRAPPRTPPPPHVHLPLPPRVPSQPRAHPCHPPRAPPEGDRCSAVRDRHSPLSCAQSPRLHHAPIPQGCSPAAQQCPDAYPHSIVRCRPGHQRPQCARSAVRVC